MRREILFTLLGFLGGFVLSGFVFWQPAAKTEPASERAPEAVPPARQAVAAEPGLLQGNCFRARRTGNGQNGDGRRGVRGYVPSRARQ